MKTIKHLFTALLLLFSVAVNAHDFEVNGIYYNITDATNRTVEVTYRGSYFGAYSNEYTGKVVIPVSVAYNGNIYSVTSIGDKAFDGCDGLTSIEIPNSVTSIGSDAFDNCYGLTSIEIPNSVTSIGNYAFRYCDGLTSIEIPNSVTSIGGGAFEGCFGLTSITIPNSVTSIGWSAFEGTAWYNNQPNGLIYAGKLLYTYKGTMPDNTSITIKDGTLGFADHAFDDCRGLTSVVIPNSVTSIGESAFYGCEGLTSIEIPNSVTSIGGGAFEGCDAIEKVELNCSSIGDWFRGKTSLKEVVIGNSVTSIGDYAFRGCDGLTSIEIPNSVTSIGDYAFYGCLEIKRFTIPDSVTSIGRSAFEGTAWYNNQPNGLIYAGKVLYTYKGTMPDNTSITIKDGTLGIAGDAFHDCSGLTSIEIPNSVTSIGSSAFSSCENLISIEIPNSVTSIGESAFYGCEGLTSVVIPNSVTSIGESAFYGCEGLTSIEIPNSVTSIGYSAFYGCSGLKTVINFSNLTFEKGSSGNGYIAYYADKVINAPGGEMTGDFGFFTADGKNYLAGYIGDDTEITLLASYKGESYEIAANAFKQNSSITNVNFTNGVTCIGENAFSGCTALEKIELPNSVTSIGNFAFYSCYGLRKVVVPENVASIGEGAFENCTAITTIHSFIPAEKLFIPDSYAFEGVDKEACILYVPIGAKDTYAATEGWSDFTNIIESENILEFTITYMVDGEVYATDTVEYGTNVTAIDEPIREGYTFSGWSEIPTTMPAEDITITGSFTVNSYTVTYMLDGEVYEAFTVEYGKELTPIAEPEAREGYTFNGWSEIPATMPAEDVTVYGSFIANSYFLTSIVDGELDYYNLEEEKIVDNFAYYRTLPNMNWNALYVPLEIAVSELVDNYDVAYINCVHSYDRDDNGEIDEMEMEVIKLRTGVLKANHPYLIRAKNEAVKEMAITFGCTTLYSAEENGVNCSSVYRNFDVIGTYSTLSAEELQGCYAISTDGMWQPLAAGTELKPFRHYMRITDRDGSPVKSENVRSMSIRVAGENTTGIEEVEEQSADNKEIYDLQGRKINEITESGIYIIDGKKIVVK